MRSEVSKFNNPEFYHKLLKYDDKSYRRFNRLTDKQQRQLREYNFLPEQVNMTLKIFHLLKSQYNTESIPFSINLCTLVSKGFYEYLSSEISKGYLSIQYLSEKAALEELVFRGYVRLSKFKVKPKRSYVMTNKPMIDGYHYIHPFEMGSNYRMVEGKDLPYLWDTFPLIGLPGYTRIIYPEMEHYPNLTKAQTNQLKIDWDIA